VPDVRLVQRDLAVLKIQQAGLKPLVVKAADDTVPAGQVIDENPGGGSKVGRGSTVTLSVSTGKPKVQVPDVRGRNVTDAITALAGIGLNPKVVHVFSPQPADTVTGQFPPPLAQVLKGSDVRINVSRGAKPVPGAGRHRAAVSEREVRARRPGLRCEARRHPVRPGAGRRRHIGPAAGHVELEGRDDHTLGLEGAGHHPGARRAQPEPGDSRVVARRRRAHTVRSSISL